MTRPVLSLCAVCLLCSCSSPASNRPDPRKELLESWTSHLILPHYAEFVERAETLEESVGTLCEEPSAATLEIAQGAWWNLREPWKENEIIKFGPYRELPLALGAKLDFWPTRPGVVQDVLDSEDPLDVESLRAFGAPARGMPAVEMLLYVEGDAEELFDPNGRRCAYLRVAAEDLRLVAEQMQEAWAKDGGNFASELTDPENGETFKDLRAALSEVANRLAFTLEDMRGEKLGRPLGEQSGGTPQPDLLESRPSGRSIQDLLDNLHGIELFYFGAESPKSALGLADFLEDEPWNHRMTALVSECQDALAAIDPLERAIEEDTASVVAAEDCLFEMQTFIQVDVVTELGLSVNFNDNDGD